MEDGEKLLKYIHKITQKPQIKLLRLAKNRDVWAKLCTYHSTSSDMIPNDNDRYRKYFSEVDISFTSAGL